MCLHSVNINDINYFILPMYLHNLLGGRIEYVCGCSMLRLTLLPFHTSNFSSTLDNSLILSFTNDTTGELIHITKSTSLQLQHRVPMKAATTLSYKEQDRGAHPGLQENSPPFHRPCQFRFLALYISGNLWWLVNTMATGKRAQRWLFLIRLLKKQYFALRLYLGLQRTY